MPQTHVQIEHNKLWESHQTATSLSRALPLPILSCCVGANDPLRWEPSPGPGRASLSVSLGPSPGSARPSRRSRVAVRARLRLLRLQVGRGLKVETPVTVIVPRLLGT